MPSAPSFSLFGSGQPKALLQFIAKARAAGDGHDGFCDASACWSSPHPNGRYDRRARSTQQRATAPTPRSRPLCISIQQPRRQTGCRQ